MIFFEEFQVMGRIKSQRYTSKAQILKLESQETRTLLNPNTDRILCPNHALFLDNLLKVET